MISRRRALELLLVSVSTIGSGCMASSDGQAGETPSDSDNMQTQVNTTVEAPTPSSTAETATEPPDRTIETLSCDEQPITSDLVIENKTSETVSIQVTIVESSDTTQYPIYKNEFTVDSGEIIREDEHIYKNAKSGQYEYHLEVDSGGTTETIGLSQVVERPTLYGSVIYISSSGLSIGNVHSDPGPNDNFDCYGN